MYIACRSKTCDNGNTDNATSCSPNERWPDESIRFVTRFECDSITPFGSPVVPEV